MPPTPPGQTRRRVLAYVRERILAGSPPTTREVQARFGFRAVQTARQHLEALVADGKLSKHLKSVCLMDQVSIRDSRRTIREFLNEVNEEAGVELEIIEFCRVEI